MRDIREINVNDGGDPISRPGPSDEAIRAFETYFGIELPKEYIQLLRYANGGCPELDTIQSLDNPKAEWAINHFYYLDEDRVSEGGLWRATEIVRPILGNLVVPFASDGGGNQFLFDFHTFPPSIKLAIFDESTISLVDLAPAFDSLIDRLIINPDMI